MAPDALTPPSNAAFEALFENVPAAVLRLDREGTILDVNEPYLKITRSQKSLEVGLCFFDFPSVKAAGIGEQLRRSVAEGVPALVRGVRITPRRRSHPIVADFTLVPVSGQSGQVTEVLLIIQDTTGLPHRDALPLLSMESPRHVCDDQGTILEVNDAFLQAYGYGREEIVGRKADALLSPRTSPTVIERMYREALDPQVGVWTGTVVHQARDGKEHVVLLTLTGEIDSDGKVRRVVGTSGNIVDTGTGVHIEADEARLASISSLAAGAAHELNTPLANVVLIAESLQRKSEDPWVRNRAQAILEQTRFATSVVRNLLDFASRTPVHLVEADLREVVSRGLEAHGHPVRPGVMVRLAHGDGPVPVRADGGQLRLVLFNLIENALDASPPGATVDVKVQTEGPWAVFTVADHGAGIPVEVLPSLFQPFFTTKPVGQGQGLGLATCYGIVRAHGGNISVHSPVGEGATFEVRLPLRAQISSLGRP